METSCASSSRRQGSPRSEVIRTSFPNPRALLVADQALALGARGPDSLETESEVQGI